jgi:hypothetical protein
VTEFTRHALDRMAQRDITAEQVEQALANPAGLPNRQISDDTVMHRGFTDGGGILWIVVSGQEGRVVSVWWELKP